MNIVSIRCEFSCNPRPLSPLDNPESYVKTKMSGEGPTSPRHSESNNEVFCIIRANVSTRGLTSTDGNGGSPHMPRPLTRIPVYSIHHETTNGFLARSDPGRVPFPLPHVTSIPGRGELINIVSHFVPFLFSFWELEGVWSILFRKLL